MPSEVAPQEWIMIVVVDKRADVAEAYFALRHVTGKRQPFWSSVARSIESHFRLCMPLTEARIARLQRALAE